MPNIPNIGIFLFLLLTFAQLTCAHDESDESLEDDDGRRKINLGRQKHFQGDLILPKPKHRNAILTTRRWPGGIIYYSFETDYAAKYQNMIKHAMRTIEKNTCVRFKERVDEPDYVNIFNSSGGCYSDGVGRVGGEQSVSLMLGSKTTCFTHAIVVHELLHVVGLWHEQMRYDRDNHITIHWDNIDEDAFGQFTIISPSESSVYDLPYDYESVMHYDAYAFSSGDGKITMEPVDNSYLKVMGKAKDASEIDWEKVRQVYECPSNSEESNEYVRVEIKPETPCTDKISTCRFNADQCDNVLIREHCRATCDQC